MMRSSRWRRGIQALDPAQPAPEDGREVHTGPAGTCRAGQGRRGSCAGCHGEAGISRLRACRVSSDSTPTYLVAAMNAYKSGLRSHDIMKALVGGLAETDVSNIALFYARQKPERAKAPAGGNPAAGKAGGGAMRRLPWRSWSQHGTAPSLAGQDATVFRRGHARLQGRIACGPGDDRSRGVSR